MRSEKIFNLASADAAATIIKHGNGVGVHEHDARTNEQVPKIETRPPRGGGEPKQRDKSYLDRSCNFLQSQQLTKREGREGGQSERAVRAQS